jgi:O-antigen ligase
VKAVAAILGLLLLPFGWRKPRYGMILLVGLQAILLGGSLQLDSEKYVYGAFFGLLMLAWLPGFWRTRKLWIRHPIAKWLLAVFGVVLASRMVGAAHGIPTIDWFRDLSPLLNYSWILLGILAFGPEVDARRYTFLLLIFIAMLTVPITLQWMYLRSFFESQTDIVENRTLGPVITLFGTFLSLVFVLDAKDTRMKRRFMIATAGFVVAAFLTGTRVALAGIATGFFVYFLLLRREGKISFGRVLRAVALPLVLLPFLLLVLAATKTVDVDAMTARLGAGLSSDILDDDTIKDRVGETLDAWYAFEASPVTGQGLGYKTDTVYHMGGIEFEPDSFFMHNFYAYLLAKVGIVGFMVFMAFLVSMVRSAIKTYLSRPEGFEKYYAAGMAALVVALMLTSITAAVFNDRLTTALLGIMVGMMIALERRGVAGSNAVHALSPAS